VAALPEPQEDVLDPSRRIIDAHHHLWAPERGYSPPTYLLDEYAADIGSGHDIEATVYVEVHSKYRDYGPEALRSVGEVEFAAAAAEEAKARGLSTRVAAGIVSRVDMLLGDAVDEPLAAHLAAAPDRVKGIRDSCSPQFVRGGDLRDTERKIVDPRFRKALARLPAFGLTFDAMVFHFQLADLLETIRLLPEVTFILDHLGGIVGIGAWAGRADEVYEQWRSDISAIAREENVLVKLGGINLHLGGFGWHKRERLPGSDELVAAQSRYFRHAIDVFGPDRCMFESNFPPDKISGSYRTLWNAFKKIAEPYSESEKDAMFFGTASRVYRL
jgi:predicted TIM-barrel fold metal-dependent hydrolase